MALGNMRKRRSLIKGTKSKRAGNVSIRQHVKNSIRAKASFSLRKRAVQYEKKKVPAPGGGSKRPHGTNAPSPAPSPSPSPAPSPTPTTSPSVPSPNSPATKNRQQLLEEFELFRKNFVPAYPSSTQPVLGGGGGGGGGAVSMYLPTVPHVHGYVMQKPHESAAARQGYANRTRPKKPIDFEATLFEEVNAPMRAAVSKTKMKKNWADQIEKIKQDSDATSNPATMDDPTNEGTTARLPVRPMPEDDPLKIYNALKDSTARLPVNNFIGLKEMSPISPVAAVILDQEKTAMLPASVLRSQRSAKKAAARTRFLITHKKSKSARHRLREAITPPRYIRSL